MELSSRKLSVAGYTCFPERRYKEDQWLKESNRRKEM